MIHLILFILIAIAFVIDARKSLIPNKVTFCGTMIGFVFHAFTEGWSGVFFAVIGAITGFTALLLLYFFGALGAGDVKLFAAIGAIMGFTFVLQSMLYAILCAGVIGLILLFIRKQMIKTGHKLATWLVSIVVCHDMGSMLGMKNQKNMKFPFMYAVVPGVALTWYYSFL
ncbi:prepilin peptidase CpaA [Paenibacillus sp. V4I9]|uniref:A24 family peptidase n=1 Tax=Paenibacillus sp. V4I9 TaxID=3042308 RepID=UPI0027800E23|nr:A24 family peptidase [Paenibacillus sp. V4I9]MDQ0888518.1 prepilin peptidase CpaA [Paenibacillus sp. V4I9]